MNGANMRGGFAKTNQYTILDSADDNKVSSFSFVKVIPGYMKRLEEFIKLTEELRSKIKVLE